MCRPMAISVNDPAPATNSSAQPLPLAQQAANSLLTAVRALSSIKRSADVEKSAAAVTRSVGLIDRAFRELPASERRAFEASLGQAMLAWPMAERERGLQLLQKRENS